jgi:hypothetical protein
VGDFCVENLVRAIEKLHRLARAHTQHAADVVGSILAEGNFTARLNTFWVMDAGNAHVLDPFRLPPGTAGRMLTMALV